MLNFWLHALQGLASGDPERNRTSNWGLGIPRYIRLTTGPSIFRPSNLVLYFQARLGTRSLWQDLYYDLLNATKKAATYMMGGFFISDIMVATLSCGYVWHHRAALSLL